MPKKSTANKSTNKRTTAVPTGAVKSTSIGAIKSKPAGTTPAPASTTSTKSKPTGATPNSATKISKTKAAIISLIAVAIFAILAIVLRYIGSYNNFLSKVTDRTPETKEYSVLVLNTSSINGLSDLTGKDIAFLSVDPKAGNAEQYLQSQVAFTSNFYNDIDLLLGALTGHISTAITLETDRINTLTDEDFPSIHDTRTVYTFTVTLDSPDIAAEPKQIAKEPFVVYISGTDSRAGISATARSDVNIIAAVNPATAKILLVSIPRDTYVQLHGTTGLKDKLTHAGIYGTEMSKATIEDLLGIAIDYTIKVSFDTVVQVVDQLDGIDITSDTAMTLGVEGKNKQCAYTVGTQHVDGDCALRFARERKSYQTGDRHRGENQQQVITSIIGKLSSSRSYLLRLPAILDIAAKSFETTFTRDNIADFIRFQLQNSPSWQVISISVDGASAMLPTYSMGANLPLYVMIPSETSLTNATNTINEYLKITE